MSIRRAVMTCQAAAGRRAARLRSPHLAGVVLLAVVAAGGYSVFALAEYRRFETSSYDLTIFDEAVRSYAHFRPGISVIKGVHNWFGPDFSVLGDHFSPILAVLAPLYWIHGAPQTLLVAQAVLFALAIPPLWVFTRRAFGGGPKATAAAYLAAAAYGLSWPIASALAFDFHEVAFAPVLTAVALERLQAGRLKTALLALAGLLLVKEDMGLLVGGIGIYIAVARPPVVRRQLLTGGCLIAAGLASSFLITYAVLPAFGGRSGYYWAYDALGANVPQALWHLITHPASLRLLVTPQVKLDTMLWLFGAFCFLPLRSPMSLAVAPLLAERMLSNTTTAWWGTPYQYNAYLVVPLLLAAVDGAARLDRQLLARSHRAAGGPAAVIAASQPVPAGGQGAVGPPAVGPPAGGSPASLRPAAAASAGPAPGRAAGGGTGRHTWTVALGCAVAMTVLGVILVPRFAFGQALHRSFYHRSALARAAAAADAAVPAGVTVAAADNLGPQLSARDTVLLWDGDGGTPPGAAPWVVADIRRRQFDFYSVRQQVQWVAMAERDGYTVVLRDDGYVVLHRAGPPGSLASSARHGFAPPAGSRAAPG